MTFLGRDLKSDRTAPVATAIETLEGRCLLSAELVTDLNTHPGWGGPGPAIHHKGLTYFVGNDGAHGAELWRSDGTAEGTIMLKDISPGVTSSGVVPLGGAGDWFFFAADGFDLWCSDGTPQNTFRMLPSGNASFFLSTPLNTAAANGDLFAVSSGRLYKTRPPASGFGFISQVKDLGSLGTHALEMVTTGSKVYFATSNGELWVSDGTSNGTQLLSRNLNSFNQESRRLTVVGDTAYFAARPTPESSGDYDLWKTQGTPQTTVRVKDLTMPPRHMTAVGDTLFFASSSGSFFGSLWKSDGTDAGTITVKSPTPQTTFNPRLLTAVGDRLFFAQYDFDGRLWTSDGTTEGTAPVGSTPVRPVQTSFNGPPTIALGGTLLFVSSDAATGQEVWRSDGTQQNTGLLVDLMPGPAGSSPSLLALAGNSAIFSAVSPEHGREMWITDGTSAGTRLLKDVNTGTAGTGPAAPLALDDHLLFVGQHPGSVMTKRVLISMAAGSSEPRALTVGVGGAVIDLPEDITRVGGRAYLTANVGGFGARKLVVTDGTPAGTMVVKDLTAAGVSHPRFFGAAGDRLFFANDRSDTPALWTSDGTADGTVMVLSLGFEPRSAARTRASIGGIHYFTATAGPADNDEEVWRSDGTAAGTWRLTNLPDDPTGSSGPDEFTVVGDRLYFVDGYGSGGKLYRTDHATGATTVAWDGAARYLTAYDGSLIFAATVNNVPRLMRLDAAAAGGAPVAIRELDVFSPLVRVGRWLYFVGADPGYARRLWRTDGTPGGTVAITALAAVPEIEQLTAAGHLLFFTAKHFESGRELWVSDGTPEGTKLAADLIPGRGSSDPTSLFEFDGKLYFGGDDGVHGRELWRYADVVPPAVTAAAFVRHGISPTVTVTFSEDVGESLSAADWVVVDRATGQAVPAAVVSMAYDELTRTAALTLNAAAMPDGDYRVTLPAESVTDGAGNAMAGEYAFDFFQLRGDANGDRAVDFADLAALAQHYNAGAGRAWESGDFTGDGQVDFDDLAIMAQRYNTSLPAPAAVAAPPNSPRSARAASIFNDATPIGRPTTSPKPSTRPKRPLQR